MKNVIVTGATGFVGRALVERIKREVGPDGKVIAIGSDMVDLANQRQTLEWFERMHWGFECDHIIHLAALYKAGGWPVEHPATQFYVNMSINTNILEAWSRFFPKAKFTGVLSYCMYPPHDEPHPESELWGTEPEKYLFSYAMTKKVLLVGLKAYRQEYGLSATSLVLPTVFGPGDSFAENSHVMGALVGKFVRAKVATNAGVEVWGDGLQEREFLYIDDAVDGIITVANNSKEEVLNLGTGIAHTIRYISETIQKKSGFKGQIDYHENRFVGVKKRLLDVSKTNEKLGWKAKISLEEGIERSIVWYREGL